MKNSKRLVVIGAGGHGRVVADIGAALGYSEIIFLDDSVSSNAIGPVSDHIKYRDEADFIVAIGRGDIRESISRRLYESGCRVVTLVHPSAVIGSNVSIGHGSVVMAAAVINTGAVMGKGTIINTSGSVDHDCVLGDYCHVSVGAHLAGTVKIGSHTMIGAGATVINNVDICNNCTIGAGAVVVKDITESGVYVGVPAKKVKNQ